MNKDLPVDTTPDSPGSAEAYTGRGILSLAASCLGLALIVAHTTHYVTGSLMLGLTSYPLTWLLLVAALSALAFQRKVSGKWSHCPWFSLAQPLSWHTWSDSQADPWSRPS